MPRALCHDLTASVSGLLRQVSSMLSYMDSRRLPQDIIADTRSYYDYRSQHLNLNPSDLLFRANGFLQDSVVF